MLLTIGLGFIYATFGIAALPWSGWLIVRKVLAAACAIFGLVVAIYPGILLGRHKARPFWTGPGIMVLFLVSSLVTGAAAQFLCGLTLAPPAAQVMTSLGTFTAGLLAFQLVLWPAYLWIKNTGTTEREAAATKRWISGDLSKTFLAGFLLAGTLIPLLSILLPGIVFKGIGAALVLLGGLLMRTLVVRGGETRTWLPGEEKYRSRLPLGDEAFLKAWKAK